MRRLTARLLLLASTDGPDSLRLAPVEVTDLLIELSARRHGENVILAVTDSGSGIPAAEMGGSSAGSPGSMPAGAGPSAGAASAWR